MPFLVGADLQRRQGAATGRLTPSWAAREGGGGEGAGIRVPLTATPRGAWRGPAALLVPCQVAVLSSPRLRPLHPREGLQPRMAPAGVQVGGMVPKALGPVERPSRPSASIRAGGLHPRRSWALPNSGVQQSQGQHCGQRVLHHPQHGPRPGEERGHGHTR